MLKKSSFTIVIIIINLCLGFGLIKAFPKLYNSSKPINVKVITELPSEIERTNPVPEVRNWTRDGRTFYYFNWGFKPTSGYSLSLLKVKGNTLTIQASSPGQGSINAQVITYPYLLLSLPKGDYRFEVVDDQNRPLQNIFQPKNPPLELTIFVPSDSGLITKRKVLRDSYLNNEGKLVPQIALEALFSQDEFTDYLAEDVVFDGISVSASRKECFVLLSHSYQTLSQSEKKLLNQLITRTLQAIAGTNFEKIQIITNPLH